MLRLCGTHVLVCYVTEPVGYITVRVPRLCATHVLTCSGCCKAANGQWTLTRRTSSTSPPTPAALRTPSMAGQTTPGGTEMVSVFALFVVPTCTKQHLHLSSCCLLHAFKPCFADRAHACCVTHACLTMFDHDSEGHVAVSGQGSVVHALHCTACQCATFTHKPYGLPPAWHELQPLTLQDADS